MNWAHIHLLINHFPLGALIFSLFFFILRFVLRNEGFMRAGLYLLVLGGLATLPTYFTGDPAEDVIKKQPQFSEKLANEHEEAAEFAIWFIEVTAVLAAYGLWRLRQKGQVPKNLTYLIIFMNLFCLTVVGRTNNLGGKISHPEIRATP